MDQFTEFPIQVVQALNPVPLDRDEEENELIKYSWQAKSEDPAHELQFSVTENKHEYLESKGIELTQFTNLKIGSDNKDEIFLSLDEIYKNLDKERGMVTTNLNFLNDQKISER